MSGERMEDSREEDRLGWLRVAVIAGAASVVVPFVVASLTRDTGWAVAGATLFLAVVTISLAQHSNHLVEHTRELASVTKELGRIEEKRDLRKPPGEGHQRRSGG